MAQSKIELSRWIEMDSYTSWETYEYAMRDYEGCGWFRTHFHYAGIPRGVLHFDGVGGCAKVFVNGKFAGSTNNRYVPFDLDVSKLLKVGDNLVAALVDNSCLGDQHLTGCRTTEWVLYGGLTHRVYFLEQPSVYIPQVRIDARRGFVPGKYTMGFLATYGPYGLVSIDRKPKQMLIDVMEEVLASWTVSSNSPK